MYDWMKFVMIRPWWKRLVGLEDVNILQASKTRQVLRRSLYCSSVLCVDSSISV